MKAGIERRRAKGKVWGEPPLGYRVQRRIGDDDEVITTRNIDQHESQIIQALFADLDTGASTGAVLRGCRRPARGGTGSEATATRMAERSWAARSVFPWPAPRRRRHGR